MEQQYLGRYAINYKANLQGTARFDRPHLNVIKNGEIVRPANQTKTYARYKITVENDGNKMLSPIYIKDLFPPGAVYVNSTLRPSLTASSANWTLTHLAVGGRSEIILWLEIGDDVSSSLVNRVEATGGHESGWASANNVSVLECGWLPCVPAEDQLLVKKSAYLNASSGDFVWYLLRIENRGNCTASLTVTDRLPGGMELVQATPDITRYNRSSNAIVWNVLAIEPQGMMTIIYKVQIIKGGRLVNQVKVEAFSPEGCDIKPAYDSIVLTMGNESDNERDQTQSDDWAPPEDWGMQCTDSSCLNLDLMI